MRLSLKTKFTLAISLLVLAVVAVVSGLYLGQLTKQVLRQSEDRASLVARQVFFACRSALLDAAERGEAPASPSAADLRQYVQRALDNSSALNSLLESALGYTATIYEITITDQNGIVLISSDAGLRGQKLAERPDISSLVHKQRFFQQLRTLYGPPQVYEYSLSVRSESITIWRYPHRYVFGSDTRRNFAEPRESRILRAWLGPSLHFSCLSCDSLFARADRSHLRTIGPHLGR